ncbi:hypothetical protein PAEPH01_1021 [Pancytospora epiphaga]|nr:hypothetical protein PAEPH01_1021 [Pancytospora epiphaga]
MAKKLKDKNAPKRPLSSFILFGNYLRETDSSIKDLSIKEQAGAIGQKWKEATEDLKERFNKKAAELKEEYYRKREEYENTEEYKEFQKMVKSGGATKEKKKRGPVKISGYRLFVTENKDPQSEDENDEELAGKNIMARCGVKWSRLTQNLKDEYNERAAKLNESGVGAALGDHSEE